MQCPNDDELIEEYHRRCAGEPLLYATHLAACADCQQRLSRLSMVDNACRRYQEPESGQCPTPMILATLAEGQLHGADQQQALAHLAGCATCRGQVKDLAMLHSQARTMSSAARGGIPWLMPLLSACAGAAVMFILLTVMPAGKMTPVAPEQSAPSVTQGHARGKDIDDPNAALRAVMPLGDEDIGYAVKMWKSALTETENTLRENPNDQSARRWRMVLKHGLSELSSRAQSDLSNNSTVDDNIKITPKFNERPGLKGE